MENKQAEDYLKQNILPDDWNKLEENINDALWTNNVIKYMEGYKESQLREIREKLEAKKDEERYVLAKIAINEVLEIIDTYLSK
jgi:nitrogen regulatory protein PII-like uncharacterized protein